MTKDILLSLIVGFFAGAVFTWIVKPKVVADLTSIEDRLKAVEAAVKTSPK